MELERGKLVPAVGLTAEDFAGFRQVEVSHFAHPYFLYVGGIQDIVVDGSQFRLRFEWVLSGVGFPPFPEEWVRDGSKNSYTAKLCNYLVANLGPGIDGGGNKIWLKSRAESLIFYPSDGRKFNGRRLQELLAGPVPLQAKGPPICPISGVRACN